MKPREAPVRTSRLHAFAESNASLWILAAAPVLWSVHFLASYAVAAALCGRLGAGSIDTVRLTITVLAAVALAGIAGVAAVGWRWHRAAGDAPPHDADSAADRRGFMGLATVLLATLSGVGVIYSALAAVFIRTCE
jgi:hypothetical protein